MARRLATAAAVAVLLSVSSTWAGVPAFRPRAHQLVCESIHFRRQECPADTRGGIRLLQQTSGICTRGVTWGASPRAVWVTNGCRAIFAVVPGPGGGPPPAGRLIVCESQPGQRSRCAARLTRRPRIEIIAGTCLEHRGWGWDRSGVWVRNGCRARFLLG